MNDNAYCGFLNVRKPSGKTSSDVVERARRILGVNLGHTGTLDPQAEGVLVLGVGPARKFIMYLQADKEYEAVVILGRESDTLDMEGRVTPARDVHVTPQQIQDTAGSLVGDLRLPVPLYSAVHVNGRRLYEMARAGESVTPPIRAMTIHSLSVLEVRLPRVKIKVSCASGTYIRTLAAELGHRLGCGAVLEHLVRIRAGHFRLEHSIPLDRLEDLAREGRVGETILPLSDALAHLPAAAVDIQAALRLQQGQPVPVPAGSDAQPGQLARVTLADGAMIGIGLVIDGPEHVAVLQPKRMLPVPPFDPERAPLFNLGAS